MNFFSQISSRGYLKSFLSVGAIQGGFMALNYLTQILLANHLNVNAYGELTYYLSLVNFFVVVVLLGQNGYLPKELIRLASKGNYFLVRTVMKRGFRNILLMWIMCTAAGFFAVYTGFWEVSSQVSAGLAAIVLFLTLGTYRQAIQRAFGQVQMSQLPEKVLFAALYLSFLCIAVFVYDHEFTVVQLISSVAGFYLLVQLIGYVLMKKSAFKIPKGLHSKTGDRKPAAPVFFYLMSVIDILDSYLDFYLLEYFAGYESLAVYSISKRVSLLVFTVIYTSNYVLGPEVSKLYFSGKINELQKRMRKAVLLNMLLATVLVLLLILFRTPLLQMFGQHYAAETGFWVFVLLMAAQWVNVTLGAPSQILTSAGFEKSVLYVFAIAVIFQLSTGWWFIGNWGITGMALLFLINSIYWNGALQIIMVKKTGVRLLG